MLVSVSENSKENAKFAGVIGKESTRRKIFVSWVPPQNGKSFPFLSAFAYGEKKTNSQLTKRGLDLGLSRGFSGSQAAKHLMGLAAANFAGGPGRKRRSLAHLS
ncbi:hypothetical protein RUM43_010496 [Polyplax serrata]|uniref:Uncharacterized protein n=1 Tax=Polyplax serrata TaxID=468196 RepID=A0AAN8P4B5_POLSC